ncbi:VOC family protein [Meiothermus ruber]|uniref:Glyoxalase/bleomycin resistance protein/dioxygenase n=1 Tax=Meiothermus ruber (strain ATCC 35948 / DSM 1279 / VKM B-1258 / 21) TaxID=504728 RepID=A0A806CS90_MEIRD|nr:VOC family protein [Meiothermus ruber]ADD29052.1 Glyoxalase/bleomycin resistance protein/dioxygenase [Meiothermus ruber DSM 1279]MCL6528614.1 bleomycin resistance protein [Meiothermus ruber]
MTIKVSACIPVIPSRDVQASLLFYQTHLGFQDPFTWGENPVEYGGVSWDGLRLHFYLEPNPQICRSYVFRLEVDEVDLLYVACEAAGIVHPNGRLENKPWATREFTLLDPSGVAIRVYQELRV